MSQTIFTEILIAICFITTLLIISTQERKSSRLEEYEEEYEEELDTIECCFCEFEAEDEEDITEHEKTNHIDEILEEHIDSH